MKIFRQGIAFFTGIIVCGFIFCIISFDKVPGKESKQNTGDAVRSFTVPALPDSMSFAGEPVPMERWEVREYFEREYLYNYYMTANILDMLKLSGRYFPSIESTLKKYNVPDDFKYLCVAESNLQNAVSRVGASGFWQFMKGTAPAYNLEISSTVDERYHVQKSTEAACKYLLSAYQRFGSWTAAAASYNCGMGGYGSRSTHQGTTNYYELALPEETQRYIFRILAFKYLLSNAGNLGFNLPEAERHPVLKTRVLEINHSISDLAKFSRQNGSTYKMLKLLNPWLRERSLVVRPGQKFYIHFPAE